MSFCFFAIIGYNNFKSFHSYEGIFKGYSAVLWYNKLYTAFGDTCFSVGVGKSTQFFNASSGLTWYYLASTVFANIAKLFGVVKDEGNGISW